LQNPLNRHVSAVCNLLTDVDEIWHYDAHWSFTADRPLKFRIFEKDGGNRHLENYKNRDISATV